MVVTSRATDGSRFVAERARAWLTDNAPAAITPALPVIDLARGELDRRTAPHIITAVADALDRGETHYTSRPGIAPLRHALVDQLSAETGIAYNPQTEILISSGGQEGLFVAVQMLVRPGDEVLLADPGYPTYADAVRLAGGIGVSVPVDPLAGTGITAAAIAARLTPHTRLLVLVSPDNPTGAVIDRTEMAKIAALAVEHDFFVLFDEIYKMLLFDGAEHVNIASFPGMRSRTVTIGSFSKGYAMTGWRVGYVAGEAHLLQPITDLKLALSICSAAPSQWAALAALTGPQDAVTEMLDDFHKRRTTLLPKLAAMGLPHGNPRGAYYAFADIRSTGLSSEECARLFLARAGVRTLPGHLFGPGGEGYLRFSLAAPAPLIREAMTRLAPIVGELKAIGLQRRKERRGEKEEEGLRCTNFSPVFLCAPPRPLRLCGSRRFQGTWRVSSTIAHADAAGLVDERDVLMDLAQHLPDVISLGLGDPDFATPAHIVAAAKEAMADGRCDHYTHPAGLIELRRAIAAKLARDNGIIADPETEITVTTGGQEGLYAIVQALLNPGDEILVPDPRYSSYDAAIGRAGGVIVPVPTRQEDDFDLRPEEVARRITPKTKAILLVTPSNPTAAVIAPAHLRAIADLAIAHDLVVIADEIYEKFVFDGAEHFSIGSLPTMRERTITLNGFSKTYAMTGWRLGYAVAPAALTQAIRALKQSISITAPAISQWAGVAALNGPQKCVDQFRTTYDARRHVLMPALDALGFTYGHPYGTFYIFANIASTGTPAFTLARKLLEEAHVLIFPGTGFGAAWGDYLRFSLLQPAPVLLEAVARLERVLRG